MSDLHAQWTAAHKAAQTFCAKNANSKKAFAKLTKAVDSKLSSCLKAIDTAVEEVDGPGFDKARVKVKPLLEDAEEAYKAGLTQKLYKQNEVRLLFAAVTASKPDSLNGKLKDLAGQMRGAERPPSDEQKKAAKEKEKAEKAEAKEAEKQQKRQEANRAAYEKSKQAVLKVIAGDKEKFDSYRTKALKVKMSANEQNGELITAHAAYGTENNAEKKAKAGEEARAAYAACGKLIAIIGDMRSKPPTTKKSDAAIGKVYPHGRTPPKDVSDALSDLQQSFVSSNKELDDIEKMLEATMKSKTPPPSEKEAAKDAKKAASEKKAADKAKAKEEAARKKEQAARAKKREKEEAKAAKEDAKQQEKQQKYQDAENAKAEKVKKAVLKIVSADQAKINAFVSEVRQMKMQAAGADGDLREARDTYNKDASNAGDYAAKREICVKLSDDYKKAHANMPNCYKSEAAVDKAYVSYGPKEVSGAIDDMNGDLKLFGEELENLHIMLDRSLREIPGPR